MKIVYEDLLDEQFEDLVIAICRRLFGEGVTGFARGKDGGRDAKFHGKAECFPSSQSPWKGVTVIQAKHTYSRNSHYRENNFFSPTSDSAELTIEANRAKALYRNGNLDNYILFANRKLTALTELELQDWFSENTGIPKESLHFVGIEELERARKRFPEIIDEAEINAATYPLLVDPDGLAEVVERMAKKISASTTKDSIESDTFRLPHAEKNKLNNISDQYAEEMRRRFLKHSHQMDDFFADPINSKYAQLYKNACDDFQMKFLAKFPKKSDTGFAPAMESFIQHLVSSDFILKKHISITRALVYYMYWQCEIGRKPDASTTKV